MQPLTPVAVKRSAARVLRSRFPNLFPSYAGPANPRGSSQISTSGFPLFNSGQRSGWAWKNSGVD